MAEVKDILKENRNTGNSSPRRFKDQHSFDVFEAYFPSSSESDSIFSDFLDGQAESSSRIKVIFDKKTLRCRRVLYRAIFIISWFVAFLGFKLKLKDHEENLSSHLLICLTSLPLLGILKFRNQDLLPDNKKQAVHLFLFAFLFAGGFILLNSVVIHYTSFTMFTVVCGFFP
mmetsp:Transcript_6825/g.5972  ORF Transcript_6825/g.5972 Transcript_6825/m.5972 type:complete len:172 (+) Transcript_6825:7-522(+)